MIAYTLPASNRGTGDGHGNAWNSTLSGGGHPGSNMPGRHHEDDENLVVEPEARALTARASGYRMDFETENFVVTNGLRASDGHHGHGSHGAIPMAGGAAGVRRLTPLECERLMAWGDDHTRWTADGREIPDSHRYRLCGNGVVSTVSEYIGHRLMAVEAVA